MCEGVDRCKCTIHRGCRLPPCPPINTHHHTHHPVHCRYALNVWFNLLNKSIFKYFPFPYTVSTVHVIVGTAYCALVYLMGLKKWSFGRVGAASTQHGAGCKGLEDQALMSRALCNSSASLC